MMLTSPIPNWDADDVSRKLLAEVLRRDGVDLMKGSPDQLARGTPVYVEAPCEPAKVLKRMARAQVRLIPVLWGGRVLELLDFVDLSRMIQPLPTPGRISVIGSANSLGHSSQLTRRTPNHGADP